MADIVATVLGIGTGLLTCGKYAVSLARKIKQRNQIAAAVEQAEQLSRSLNAGGVEVNEEIYRLRKLKRDVAFLPNGSSERNLAEAQSILGSLQNLLAPLATGSSLMSIPDFAKYQVMADKARNLTLQSLQQWSGQLIAQASSISLLSGSSLSPDPFSSAIAPSNSIVLSRGHLNFHNICKNARLYRESQDEFEDLATPVPGTDEEQWTCKHCSMHVGKSALKLSSTSDDHIWIAPVGMFKAHCARVSGQADGWTCIWVAKGTECHSRFSTERALLEHMKRRHVVRGVIGQDAIVHWPEGLGNWKSETCGYGATIGGREMEDSHGTFRIPA